MSDTCPVVKIVSTAALGYTLLDESAFDPARHELWRESLDASEGLDAVRAEYLAVIGKKPWNGWGVDVLRVKIAEKKGADE